MKFDNYMDPRKTFGKAVTQEAEKNEDIVVLSADSGKSSGFGEFIEKYPDRYFECGIMEQGVIGISSGLATTGKVPVFCAIAPFVTARPFEMFRNDLGYMNQNVKVVGRNCGITYSDLGATHHSLEDFAIVRMIPGVTILAPQDPYEIEEAVKAMLSMNGPVYMRIGNPKIPVLFEKEPFVIGKGRKITEGEALTLITTGSMTMAAMEAVERLEEEGIQVEHIGMPTVWPIDAELICDSVKKTGRVMTIEEHYIKGGLGTIVMETLNDNGINVPIKMHGIPHCYASNGPYNELMAYYKLDADGVYGGIKEFLNAFDELTFTKYDVNDKFSGIVNKIRYDSNGTRITFIKALSGKLKVRDEIEIYKGEQKIKEKISSIRIYNGNKFISLDEAQAGDIFAVTGLSLLNAGDVVGNLNEKMKLNMIPTLMSSVIYDKSYNEKEVLKYFKILEAEDPALNVLWNGSNKEIQVHIMGKIQLEVLKEVVLDRFNLDHVK